MVLCLILSIKKGPSIESPLILSINIYLYTYSADSDDKLFLFLRVLTALIFLTGLT